MPKSKKSVRGVSLYSPSHRAHCPGTSRAKYARLCRPPLGSCEDESEKAEGEESQSKNCGAGSKRCETVRDVQRRVAFRRASQQGKCKAGFGGVARHARGIGITWMDAGEVDQLEMSRRTKFHKIVSAKSVPKTL